MWLRQHDAPNVQQLPQGLVQFEERGWGRCEGAIHSRLGWESEENPISRLLATGACCAPLLTGFSSLAGNCLTTGSDAIGPSPHDRQGNLYLGVKSGKNRISDVAC